MLKDALQHDFIIPDERYHLAAAGYPLVKDPLIPFRGVRYHMNEWGKSDQEYVYRKSIIALPFAGIHIALSLVPSMRAMTEGLLGTGRLDGGLERGLS